MDSGGTNHHVMQCKQRGTHRLVVVELGASKNEENRFGACRSRHEEDGLSVAKISISLSARAQRFRADDTPLTHGHGKALAMDPRLSLFQHDEWIIQCLNRRRRGCVPRRGTKEDTAWVLRSLVASAGFKKGNLAVDLALSYSWLVVLMITVCVDACPRKNTRASKEVSICSSMALNIRCGRIVVSSWDREHDRNMGRQGGDGGIHPLRRPKSDTGHGGYERMKRRKGVDGILILTPSNGESNPATQHAVNSSSDSQLTSSLKLWRQKPAYLVVGLLARFSI
ncbi:hypothetical protein B0H14DRAFT_2648553 [Mycena olivaceomarginata]|nr:hypothetical protein B0H14DRAFT_2648553 [Mycena olivaceomarginata]